MPKRQTTRVQRRTRASQAAMTARVGAGTARPPVDIRLVAIGGFLLIGIVLVVLFLVLNTGDAPIGQVIPTAGRDHERDGTPVPPDSYTSIPATSGPHWETPAQWGIYPGPFGAAVPESQSIHNLEHGGIAIWYQPGRLDQAGIDELAAYVRDQLASNRFKFILSAWQGGDFGHAVAVTAWTRLLYVDCAGATTSSGGASAVALTPAAASTPCDIDIEPIREFADRYYQRLGPEPQGGPPAPAG
ncbi:MAG: DUF3105 domain-containing protein [Candidatus Limnocylindria bacterium]